MSAPVHFMNPATDNVRANIVTPAPAVSAGPSPPSPKVKKRIKIHPLFFDLGITASTSAAVLVSGLLMVALFGKMLGAIALAEFLLVKRLYAWLQSFTILGVDMAMPRYVAMTDAKKPRERDQFLVAGILLGGAVTLVVFAILNSADTLFSNWLFGSADFKKLILSLSVFLAGGSAHGTVYGFYRGRLQMKHANALQVLNVVVLPILAIVVFARFHSTALIVDVIGMGMIFFSSLFAVPLVPRMWDALNANLRPQFTSLLQYSVPRLPSLFAFGALMALGPVIASHRLPLSQVSYLLLGMSILMGISASAEPIGLILLSKVSMVVSQDRHSDLRLHLQYLQEAVLACYVFAGLQLIVFADVIVKAWVGNHINVDAGLGVIRVTLLSIPFYLLFACLRSVVDATSVTPYNTYNVLITLAAFLGMLGFAVWLSSAQTLLLNIALCIVVSQAILAWLTARIVRKLYRVQISWSRIATSIVVACVLAGVSFFARHMVSNINFWQCLLIEFFVGALFLFALRRLGSPWMPFFWNLAIQRRPANA
jgi:O-antigen/teichoic acid export membrane protein